jgi:hypothetical protein
MSRYAKRPGNSRTLSAPIGFDPRSREYLKPIVKALDHSQHRAGRFRFYGYLAAVYRPYQEWRELGISRRMARRLAKQLSFPYRKNTSPVRILIDATFPKLPSKQKSRWSRALEFAAIAKVAPEDLPQFFKNSSGVAGCARLATKRSPKKSKNSWL